MKTRPGEPPWADCPSPIRWERVPEAGEGSGLRWRKELHRDFERALSTTKLSESPDSEAANRFLIKARWKMANLE